jgi:hypothetical protein
MRCLFKAWAAARSRWHLTSPRLAWRKRWQPDRRGRSRPPSTVYMPGYKLTMLPDALA